MRRFFLSLLGLLVLAFLGFSIYWWIARDIFDDGLADWRREVEAQGLDVAFVGPEVRGFPLSLSAVFGAPQLGLPTGERWEGPPGIVATVWLWDLSTVEIMAPGRQRLVLPQATLQLDTEATMATAGLRDGRLDSVGVALLRPLLSNVDSGQSLKAGRFGLSAGPLTPQPDGSFATGFSLDFAEVPVPPAAAETAALLGPLIDRFLLSGTFKGALLPGAPREIAARWRDASGVVDFTRIELVWGDLRLVGDGTLTLDEAFRPLGAFSFRTAGVDTLIERLIERGAIPGDAVLPLKLAVAAIAGDKDETGLSRTPLAVTLQDGGFYVGPARVASLRPVF